MDHHLVELNPAGPLMKMVVSIAVATFGLRVDKVDIRLAYNT